MAQNGTAQNGTVQNGTVRVAALADIHCRATSTGQLQPLLSQINAAADVLLLGGDLTDRGLGDEAHVLAKELTSALKIPIVAVLGNHDFESGLQDDVFKILADAGVYMLDGEACEIEGIGFAGVKGFAGGFAARTLQAWGENTIKSFVREAVEEALKLESALAKLRTDRRVVLLHYAPVKDTVRGEPPEIYPFLGSSRLEEPLTRFGVSAVFHGHAHAGSPEGRALGDIPVYNVAIPVLKASFRDRPPFRVIEIPLEPDVAGDRFQHEASYSVLNDVDH